MKAKSNVLIALRNILKHNSTRLTPIYKSNGSANATGDNLEFFIKDMFCWNALQYSYQEQKEMEYKKLFSWTGDSTHFPDLIIKGGAGIESKKVNDDSYSTVPLNSSYPKDYITSETQNYPKDSLKNEPILDWDTKPVIYAIGNLNTKNPQNLNQLKSLWFVYGNTMVPKNQYYQEIIKGIRNSIQKSAQSNIDWIKSKELARVHGIDKLKRTNMRVRGMYELQHPEKIFNKYINNITIPKNKSKIYVVILDSDLNELIQDMDQEWENLSKELDTYKTAGNLFVKNINLPDPNGIKSNLPATIFVGYTN
ncbi:restriction endonuclease [Lactobacillus bombicola]|uniref:Restriction endonuclease n=1 Tax=Lactobacillus bombicola TaxID=1505723 RepID=A0ABX9LTF9_9LACO|nr:NgoPII family restriction endonuclease [Lactobacillus bombicola]RHW50337.1 restriction endonuclease [Lactobacillus bombicola]